MADTQDPRSFLNSGEEAVIRHWATYGQRGTTPTRRAMPWDWEQVEFIKPESAAWDVLLKSHQVPLLLLGFIPSGAADFPALMAQTFQVGEIIMTHGFMSTSKDPDVKASEDKWFVYSIGPNTEGIVNLNICRSWTGNKMIELVISIGSINPDGTMEDAAKITRIHFETDPSQWRGGMKLDQAQEVAREVCRWVLNVDLDGSQEFQHPTMNLNELSEALKKLPPSPGIVYSQR